MEYEDLAEVGAERGDMPRDAARHFVEPPLFHADQPEAKRARPNPKEETEHPPVMPRFPAGTSADMESDPASPPLPPPAKPPPEEEPLEWSQASDGSPRPRPRKDVTPATDGGPVPESQYEPAADEEAPLEWSQARAGSGTHGGSASSGLIRDPVDIPVGGEEEMTESDWDVIPPEPE